MLIGVTETISMNIDKVFISYFWGVSQVGYYASGQSMIAILTSIGGIFIGILLPTYSSLHAENRMDEIRRLANRVERYISLILVPLVFAVFFFADPIRQLVLGPRFDASTPILRILVLNAMLVIFTQPYSTQLMGTNRIKLGMLLGLIMLSTNIAMNLILIPRNPFRCNPYGVGKQRCRLVSSCFLLHRHSALSLPCLPNKRREAELPNFYPHSRSIGFLRRGVPSMGYHRKGQLYPVNGDMHRRGYNHLSCNAGSEG